MTINPLPWDINPYLAIVDSLHLTTTNDANTGHLDLNFWIPSGYYAFEVNLGVAAGTDIKCDLNTTAGTFSGYSQALKVDSGTGNLTFVDVGFGSGSGTFAVTNIKAGNAFRWWGCFQQSLNAQLQFRWSRNTASGTSTLVQNSYMMLHRMG